MREIISVISVVTMLIGSATAPAAEISAPEAPHAEVVDYVAKTYLTSAFTLPADSVVSDDQAQPGDEEQSAKAVAAVVEAAAAVPTSTPAEVAPAPAPAKERRTYLGEYRLTGYCACEKCCGKKPSHPAYGITASGARAKEGVTIAMAGMPFGTRVYIEGVGERVVQDRGVKGKRIDVFSQTHKGCYRPELNCTTAVWIIED